MSGRSGEWLIQTSQFLVPGRAYDWGGAGWEAPVKVLKQGQRVRHERFGIGIAAGSKKSGPRSSSTSMVRPAIPVLHDTPIEPEK